MISRLSNGNREYAMPIRSFSVLLKISTRPGLIAETGSERPVGSV